MARIVVSQFVSLDGVIEDPSGWRRSAAGRGRGAPAPVKRAGAFKVDEMIDAEAMLLGRKTYDGASAPRARTALAGAASTSAISALEMATQERPCMRDPSVSAPSANLPALPTAGAWTSLHTAPVSTIATATVPLRQVHRFLVAARGRAAE